MTEATEHPKWAAMAPLYVSEIEAHFEREGVSTTSAASRSTLRTNGELVPRRAATIVRWLSELIGPRPLEAKRVLEMGCGFGALAAYFAVEETPRHVVACDNDPRMLGVAARAATALGLQNLSTQLADMRDLGCFEDDSFDVLLLNNSFIYLAEVDDQRRALCELRRILAPNGWVLVYHANKWQLREPFTKAPLAHLLPARLGNRLGLPHNHGRVRYLSTRQMARAMTAAGFRGPQLLLQPSKSGLVERHLTTFYGMAARG